jgi:hypothetical protein
MSETEGWAEAFTKIDPVALGHGEKDLHEFGIELLVGTAANLLVRV